MKRPARPKPFDVTLTDEQKTQLGGDLARDIEEAFMARAAIIANGGKIDLADWFYEQGQSLPQDRPFEGAADLTSYFITENVDAMKARQVQAVFGVRPFCFVEGKGQDAKKAPVVEEFLDWQVRKSTLKSDLAKVVLGALIEDCYILEVSEKVETRRLTTKVRAAFHVGDDGAPVFADGKPKIQTDDAGDPVPAQEGQPHAELEYTTTKTKRLGPKYTPISMKDFVFLPGHAKNADQVWGYAYRFTARLPELQEQVKDGVYDEAAVKELGDSSDTQESLQPSPSADVAAQYDESVEKELFQLAIKRDFDKDGREEWYIATVSLKSRVLLRLKLDKFVQKVGRSRCVPFVLFPRRNSVYGYSYAFDKLLTLAEEHTSLRNMKADRSALATNAPIMQTQNGLWDSEAEPFGVGRVIHVKDMHELQQMQVADVPVSVVQQEQALHQAKERVGGLSDSAVGILSGERRTLGENKLVAGGSAVRVKEVTSFLQLAIADVMYLTHAYWVEALETDPKGLEAPDSVVKSMKQRGAELSDGRITADMIRGDFQFEPYGSDETADPEKKKADFNTGLQALAGLSKAFPMLALIMNNPETTQAILEQWLRVFDIRDREPYLNAFKAAVQQQQQMASQPPMPGMGAPGAPAGGLPGGLPPEIATLFGGGGPGMVQ